MLANIAAGATLLLVAALAFTARVIVDAEYSWWGRALAERTCGLASKVARPRATEWRSLLSERQSQLGIPCVLFALDLLRASIRMRVAHILAKLHCASWSHLVGLAAFFVFGPMNIAFLPAQIQTAIARPEHRWFNLMLLCYTVLMLPLGLWTARCCWRSITLMWALRSLRQMKSVDEVPRYIWTRSEAHALLAIASLFETQADGTPPPLAHRRLQSYIRGRLRPSPSSARAER